MVNVLLHVSIIALSGSGLFSLSHLYLTLLKLNASQVNVASSSTIIVLFIGNNEISGHETKSSYKVMYHNCTAKESSYLRILNNRFESSQPTEINFEVEALQVYEVYLDIQFLWSGRLAGWQAGR